MKNKAYNLKSQLLMRRSISKFIFLILVPITFVHSQVNLKINPYIIVKTSDGGSVKVTGNLIEVESGYFNGLITSGHRTNINGFAGLTLGLGLEGSIQRITGKSYYKGNGELPNFKRYFEIDNTGGNEVITSMELKCLISDDFDESSSITPPYHIYSYSTDWTGYGEGSANPPVTAENVTIPAGLSDWIISDNTGIVSVDELVQIPSKYELFQNYPNPFNPETIIKFALPESNKVRLSVYSILGEKVKVLVNKILDAGYHSIAFNAAKLGSGTYIYKIEVKEFIEIKKMILIK